MNDKEILTRVTFNPEVMAGKPTLRGLRITVEQIFKSLAAGVTNEEILEDYPELDAVDIKAALLYATELISHQQVFNLKIGA
ncbi:MAG: DUF433 domain-containing protein [bacterium]|nr:DUF433 domain-containing protein [bacterium]